MRPLLLVLIGLLVLCGIAALGSGADPEPRASWDEKLLKEAGVDATGPALLDFFRKRTPSAATCRQIDRLIEQLDSNSFLARQQASRTLVELGPVALPALRRATIGQSLELTTRAQRCLRDIQDAETVGLPAAAARLLKVHKPDRAWAVLLAYLPYADSEPTQEVVAAITGELAVAEGVVERELREAAAAQQPLRRMAAAAALARAGAAEERALAHGLLADPEPRVRFFAARSLLAAGDKTGVPALVTMVSEGPLDFAHQADNLLCRLAGERIHTIALSSDFMSRAKCAEAWAAWWKSSGDRIDLAKLNLADELEPDLVRLAERMVALIQARQLNGAPGRNFPQPQILALLVAASAQNGPRGADSMSRATLRDLAIDLSRTLRTGKADAKLLRALPYQEADYRARPGRVPLLGVHADMEEVMQVFRPKPRGGLGIEKKLNALAENKTKRVPEAELTEDFEFEARVVAQVAEWIKDDYKPMKKPAEWKARAEEARVSALDLARVIKARDVEKAWPAVRRLDNACMGCHEVFRE